MEYEKKLAEEMNKEGQEMLQQQLKQYEEMMKKYKKTMVEEQERKRKECINIWKIKKRKGRNEKKN